MFGAHQILAEAWSGGLTGRAQDGAVKPRLLGRFPALGMPNAGAVGLG